MRREDLPIVAYRHAFYLVGHLGLEVRPIVLIIN